MDTGRGEGEMIAIEEEVNSDDKHWTEKVSSDQKRVIRING